jgi:uncharacterized protein YjiS (DUF1127 family)
MMEESLHGEYHLSSLDQFYDECRRQARRPGTVWAASVVTLDGAVPHRLPSRTSPDVPLTGRAPRRAETRHISPLTAIRRIATAFRLWRRRARSRQELRELSDHLLNDIGLRREEVGYAFPKPFWYCD